MNTLKFLNNLKDKSLGSIRSALYQLSIKTGYDKENRIILFPNSRGENVIGKINNEANGLVLLLPDETNENKTNENKTNEPIITCLSIPMYTLRNSNQINKQSIVSEWNKNTRIYPCREGTNIVLYWFKDRWCMSTSKGIEVNNLKWNNGKTYQEMFMDAVIKKISNDTWGKIDSFDGFCKNLNKDHCYCMGFWHPDFHVFGEGEPNFWTYKVTNSKTLKDTTLEYVNSLLNIYEMIIPLEIKKDTNEEIVEELFKNCEMALDNYFENNKCINLGYMVRGLDNGDVLFESKLQTTINDLYYNAQFTKSISMTSYSRHKYVLLINYIHNNDVFLQIFPKYQSEFDRFAREINLMIENLELIYRKSKRKPIDLQLNKYLPIANEIKKNIDQLIKINVDDKLFRTKIMSILYHPNHFDAIYRLIYE